MRRWMVVAIMIVSLLLPASSAAGGGWWSSIELDETYWAIGEEVTITSDVWTEPGEVRYFAYLMPFPGEELWDRVYREYDPGWWTPQEGSLVLGELSFDEGDTNTTPKASVVFEVPAVDPGKYAVMFCSEGCADPLGSLIPTAVMVVTDPAHAAAAIKVDDLRVKLYEMRHRHRREVRGLERRIEARDRVSSVIDERMDGLDARLLTMTSALRGEPEEKPSSLPYLLAGAALGAAVVFVGTRLSRLRMTKAQMTG